jgi:hypothetical protein
MNHHVELLWFSDCPNHPVARQMLAYADSGDYTPRCRLYWTAAGLRGVPDPAWIEEALRG